ncbi:hypothetical protein CVIRNUC_003654 [Coccomyxa viridis]|uniref:ABC transporter domain-containing protein n=1 Tax=Coccomyxa viridis TaxID=1274662 RepID=A0AAV1HZ75_9CHLO|nr:hypothetical protein CVIRNUC_003654 [Coccomyxa viridis]
MIVAESTYISQEDHFLPSMTCFETLRVAAALKVKGSPRSREGVIEQSLGAVGLLKVADSQVGGLLPGGLRVRGISGGEKRRLSIACGIVGAPELIFLDEPTSGLDTSSALTVMQCIRSLADEGRIVLSSIHQPRARIWELFDSVVVLAEGLPVEKKADEACGGGSLSSEDIIMMATKLSESYKTMVQPPAPAEKGLSQRNPANAAGRTVMAVGLAVLVGAVFFRQPSGDEGVRQDVAALFFVALLLTLMPYTYMSMFVADRVFFQEDPLQPLYSTPAYYASVSGINALVSTLNGILLMLIVYGFLGECFSRPVAA